MTPAVRTAVIGFEVERMHKASPRQIMRDVEAFEGFCNRLQEQVSDAALLDELHTQMRSVESLKAVIQHVLIDEGRDARVDLSPRAEIERKPLQAENPFSCTPLFIIGNRRSGTTLLAYLLNASQSICALPEVFMASAVVQSEDLFKTALLIKNRIEEPLPSFFVRLGKLVDDIYAAYAQRFGKTRWVSKELFVGHRLDRLDRIFDYRARFVYIARHGFDVAYSCASRFPMRDGAPRHASTSLDLDVYLREWVANNDSSLDFCERNPERCLLIRYEDLTADPECTAQALYRFVGEPWGDDVWTRFEQQQLFAMGDDKIEHYEGRIVARQPVWQDWPRGLVSALGRRANGTLRRLGYPAVE